MSVISFALGGLFYNLLDDGIANVLNLETLRHGTNPYSNIILRIKGGDPDKGASSFGSTKNFSTDNPVSHFYLFKDNEVGLNAFGISEFPGTPNAFLHLIKRHMPRIHAALSGYNFFSQVLDKESLKDFSSIKVLRVFIGIIGSLTSFFISPTLRFRFSEIDSNRFENDPPYAGLAYRTQLPVEPWRIGPMGSLITGLNPKRFSKIKINPMKILTGIVQITCAIAIGILCVSSLVANPVLIIPAVIGGLLV